MTHRRVDQLRFARAEWQRGLAGLSEADAAVRLPPEAEFHREAWRTGLTPHPRKSA